MDKGEPNGLDAARAILDGAPDGFADRFRTSVYPRTVDGVVDAVMGRQVWRRWLRIGGAAAVALAAVLLLLWVRSDRPAELAVKGASLQIHARRGEHTFRVDSATVLRAGDRLRFTVTTGVACHVLVASVDGRSTVSVFYPSTAVPAGATTLEGSIRLDDAPGPERVFVYFSDGPIEEARIRTALENDVPVALERLAVTIVKGDE